MNQLFTIGAEYTKDQIMAIAGNRLRMVDLAAVGRFDDDHWALMLDEDNGWWQNWLEPGKVTMGVNPRKRGLNHKIRFAYSRGESTFMFYRQSGRHAADSGISARYGAVSRSEISSSSRANTLRRTKPLSARRPTERGLDQAEVDAGGAPGW